MTGTPPRGVDRSRPPAPAPSRDFRFPEFRHLEITPGLDLLVAPLSRAPLVSLEVVLPAGGGDDPGWPGLVSLTASLLDDGTETRSATEIAAEVERLGGSLFAGADWNASSVSCSLLSRHWTAGLDLLAELARKPSFPEEEITRLRSRRTAELLRQRTQPGALAQYCFADAVFRGSAYGRPLIGTSASLQRLRRPRVVELFGRKLRRGGAAVLAAGDVEPDELRESVGERLADWPKAPPASSSRIEPVPRTSLEVLVVDRPEAAQTELVVGHAGPPRRHPDWVGLTVTTTLLGGKFTSRINLNLRERNGYTYGAHARLSARRGPGSFQITAAVATDKVGAALQEIDVELRRLRDEVPPAGEVEETVSYLRGVFPYSLQSTDDVAKRLSQLVTHRLPDDYFDRLPDDLAKVTPEAVNRLARTHLDPDRMVAVAVGPAEQLEPQLAALGELRLWEPDF